MRVPWRALLSLSVLLWTWPLLVLLWVVGRVTAPRTNTVKIGSRVRGAAARCPSFAEFPPFPLLALPWLRGHLFTVLPEYVRDVPSDPYDMRSGLVRPDGARLGLWCDSAPDTPIVVVFPGLTGGAKEGYVLSMVSALRRRLHVRVLVVPGRGNHDSQLGAPTLAKDMYNARATGDQVAIIEYVRQQQPLARAVYAIGFSLGANILVNALADCPGLVDGAMVISCPWDLRRSSRHVLERSWLYSYAFGRALGAFAVRNRDALVALYRARLGSDAPLVEFLNSRRSKSVLEFDSVVTARVAGYASAEDYYADASCHNRVHLVDVPMLALSALDDPCVDSRGMPLGSGSEYCAFVMTECGGHLGYLMSRFDWRRETYDNVLACEWFGALLAQRIH